MGRRGFTLIELLVVIGIIIAISLMMLPAMLNVMRYRALRDGCRMIQMSVLKARSTAVTKRRSVWVRFETIVKDGETRWQTVIVDLGEDATDPADDQQLPSQLFPERVTFNAGSNGAVAFRLEPDGTLELYNGNDYATAGLVADVLTSDFEKDEGGDPAVNHDFYIEDVNGDRAYANVVPTTGRMYYHTSFDD